jgi:hypothetical protein
MIKIRQKTKYHRFFNGLLDLHRINLSEEKNKNQNNSYDGDDFSHVVCIEIF